MSGAPDPKPGKTARRPIRTRDSSVLLRAALEYPWCPCGAAGGSVHHVVPRGAPHFGDDDFDNAIVVCGSGTTGHHGGFHAGNDVARRMIGRALERRHVEYVLGKLGDLPGREWLKRRYLMTDSEITRRLTQR